MDRGRLALPSRRSRRPSIPQVLVHASSHLFLTQISFTIVIGRALEGGYWNAREIIKQNNGFGLTVQYGWNARTRLSVS